MKHACRISLQGRQKRAVIVQAERNQQKQARYILCQSTTLCTWQKGQSLHNTFKVCMAPRAEDSHPTVIQQQKTILLKCVNSQLAIAYRMPCIQPLVIDNSLALGDKLPGLQHEHSSHMQHAYHTSSQEPDNPLGMASSSSINSPLAIGCECTSPSCSASSSKCTPPAKHLFYKVPTFGQMFVRQCLGSDFWQVYADVLCTINATAKAGMYASQARLDDASKTRKSLMVGMTKC